MKPNLAELTEQFGFILFVEKFFECEKFYAETIGLRILYRKEWLTAFEFGNGYLMLEGEANKTRKAAQGSFVIRFNVRDLAGGTKYLEHQGVDLVTHHFDWGSIAVFTDPDGNRCELRHLQCGSVALSQGVASIQTQWLQTIPGVDPRAVRLRKAYGATRPTHGMRRTPIWA